MGLVVYLILLFFVGLVVGALARLLLPGPDPMGIGMTALVVGCAAPSALACSRAMCCIGTARGWSSLPHRQPLRVSKGQLERCGPLLCASGRVLTLKAARQPRGCQRRTQTSGLPTESEDPCPYSRHDAN